MMRLLFGIWLALVMFAGEVIQAQTLPTLIPYRSGNSWGFSDTNGRVVITPQWDEVYFYYQQRAVVRAGSSWCVIDTSGHYIIPPSRHWNGIRRPGIENSSLNSYDSAGRWGFIDADNNVIIPFLYDAPSSAYTYSWLDWFINWGGKTIYIAGKQGKKGLIDGKGRVMIPFEYDALLDSCRDYFGKWEAPVYFYAKRNGRVGMVDTTGREVVPVVYKDLKYLYEFGIAIASSDSGMGVLDLNGRVLVPLKYDDVRCYERNDIKRNAFFITKKGKQGWVDYTEHLTIEPKWDYFWVNEDSSFTVRRRGKYGLLGPDGKQLLPPRYSSIEVRDGSVRVWYTTKGLFSRSITVNHMTTYDKTAGKLVTPWKINRYKVKDLNAHLDSIWKLDAPSRCGYSSQSQNIIDLRTGVKKAGQTIYSFHKDSLEFRFENILSEDPKLDGTRGWDYVVSADAPSNAIAGADSPPVRYYAVVDTAFNYLIAPESKYALKTPLRYGRIRDNAVVAVKDGKYGVVDQNLRVLVDFQPELITDYFHAGPDWYALTSSEVVNALGMVRSGSSHLVNSAGVTPPGFSRYTITGICDSVGIGTGEQFKGFFMVYDSSGRAGLVDGKGTIQFPELSFKYGYMHGVGGGKFLKPCTDAWLSPCNLLVDRHDRQLFNDVRVTETSSVGSITFGYIYNAQGNVIYADLPLIKVTFTNPVSRVFSYFYMDGKGRVYADGLGVK